MPKIIKLAKGSYTTSDITIDSSGRVITASSGTAGGGAMIMQYSFRGPATGTFATNNGNYAMVYAASGAGGGGGVVLLTLYQKLVALEHGVFIIFQLDQVFLKPM